MSYKPAAHLAPVTKTLVLIGREETRWRTPGRWLGDAARQLTSVRCRPWSREHLDRVTSALLASRVCIIRLPTLEGLLQAEVVLFYSLIKTVTCKQWVDQASRDLRKETELILLRDTRQWKLSETRGDNHPGRGCSDTEVSAMSWYRVSSSSAAARIASCCSHVGINFNALPPVKNHSSVVSYNNIRHDQL